MQDSNDPVVPTADASMDDMLRIMDVATALRRQRETAEAQLDVATAKIRLRERLLATAAAAGEPVTAAEVDAAIEEYFRRQHEYRDPPRSWTRLWAHLGVMRGSLLVMVCVLSIATVGVIFLAQSVASSFTRPPEQPKPEVPRPVFSTPPTQTSPVPYVAPLPTPRAPVPAPVRDTGTELAALWASFERDAAAATALAADDDARRRVQRVVTLGTSANTAGDLVRLRSVSRDLAALMQRLDEEYVVTIVSRQGEQSGIDRYQDGKLSGYYVIVEAIAPNGSRLSQRIKNAETGSTDAVTKWGELVPEAVWSRIVADKKADGVIDDAEFARKVRGSYAESTTILDGSGKPLRRGRQITRW
jgi:hypothetical protein